jgi:hypothetical protein
MSELKKYLKNNKVLSMNEMFVLEREEAVVKTDGGIYIAEEGQRIPITGIAVAVPEKYEAFLGQRIYFRPGTELMLPLGSVGDGPIACLLHLRDIKLVEEVK